MVRCFVLFACLLPIFATGCIGQYAVRQRRDVALLSRDDGPRQAPNLPEAAEQLLPDPLDGAWQARVFVSPEQNQDGTLPLRDVLISALRNSKIVRLIDGNAVRASAATGYDVESFQARAQAALAAFDTNFSAGYYTIRFRQPPSAFFGPGLAEPTQRDEMTLSGGISKPLITGGLASVFYDPSPGYLFLAQGNPGGFNPAQVGALTFQIRQPLLRGAGIDVNSAPIQIAQIQVEQSAWDFKKAAMESLREIVEAYWDLHAARIALEAIDEVIPLLEEVVDIQQKAFAAQWSIYADVAKAHSQLHQFRQQRLALQSVVMQRELRLRNLAGLPPADGWKLVPVTPPATTFLDVDAEAALQAALANQPDLVRQRLNVRIREKELLVAQNGLKPQLDFQALYRMNGLGENLGDALSQLATNAYADWQLGAAYSMALGRRRAFATNQAVELQVARERALLQQSQLTTAHQLADVLRQMRYAYGQYQEADLRLKSANDWMQGARLRYRNPLPVGDAQQNWLLQYLNDFLAAVRFRTDAATDAAALLAIYNGQLARLEEVKGTLLDYLQIDLSYDPCRQAHTVLGLPVGSENPSPPASGTTAPPNQIELLPPAQAMR